MFDSSWEQFEKIVRLLEKLLAKGLIRWAFSSADNVEFVVLQEAQSELQSEYEDDTEWKNYLNSEISQYVIALLSDTTSLMRRYVVRDEDIIEERRQELLDLLNQKLQLVDEHIMSESLRHSYLVKSTSKIETYTQVDWEINEKVFDDTDGVLPNVRYAVIRLRTANKIDTEGYPFPKWIFGDIQSKGKVTTFVCDKSDIDALITTLNDIKKSLESGR